MNDTSGILVHPSPRATFARRLADAIEMLARDPERAQAMGAAGRRRAMAEFDWEKKVDRLVGIFNEVTPLSGPASSPRRP